MSNPNADKWSWQHFAEVVAARWAAGSSVGIGYMSRRTYFHAQWCCAPPFTGNAIAWLDACVESLPASTPEQRQLLGTTRAARAAGDLLGMDDPNLPLVATRGVTAASVAAAAGRCDKFVIEHKDELHGNSTPVNNDAPTHDIIVSVYTSTLPRLE